MAILPPSGHSKRIAISKTWRGGRVVECTALEMRHTGNRIGGSNPSLSASASPERLTRYGYRTVLLQLAADLAVERIRAAAAQRDGKAQQSPQQHIFVAAFHPGEAIGPIRDRDEQHLDGGSSGKESGEQPKDEGDAAKRLDQAGGPKPE